MCKSYRWSLAITVVDVPSKVKPRVRFQLLEAGKLEIARGALKLFLDDGHWIGLLLQYRWRIIQHLFDQTPCLGFSVRFVLNIEHLLRCGRNW